MTHKMASFSTSIGIRLFCVFFLLALALWGAGPVSAAGDFADVDAYVNSFMRQSNIPGLALAITRGDQVAYSAGYGIAAKGRPVTPDTPFFIGSQSKSFTALAVMQLVEQGRLELDAPIQDYLPWFRVADEQASREITLRHLLQHTSGLSEAGYMPDLPADATLEMLVRDLSRARLTAPVGTKMQYFNPGYSTLGLLIETVSGQSYGEYLRQHIFEPLKMTHTFTDPAAAREAGLAQGYSQLFLFAVPLEQPVHQYDLPAGFIMSSANDMARFLMAMGNGGELEGARILSPENIRLMFTPNTSIDSSYGFGWFIGNYRGETKITHGGATERFHTSVLLLPDQKLTWVMLVNENHLLKGMNEYDALFRGLTDLLTGHPVPARPLPSIVIGAGLFVILLWIVVSTVRDLVKLPAWRAGLPGWDARRRWKEILKHVFSIGLTILAVTVIVPAFLQRGFSWRWFAGFLPDVAIVVGALVFEDLIQIILKTCILAKNRIPCPKNE